MTSEDFIAKWGPGGPAYYLNEEQGAQSHFIDLCDLLGVPKPGSEDGYIFEKQTLETRVVRLWAPISLVAQETWHFTFVFFFGGVRTSTAPRIAPQARAVTADRQADHPPRTRARDR